MKGINQLLSGCNVAINLIILVFGARHVGGGGRHNRMTQTNLASLLCMSGKIWCIAKSDVIQLLLFHHQMRGEGGKKRGERLHNELVPRGGQFLALTFSPG